MGSGFDPQRPAFATWLNTTPYLTEDAIFATLDGLARVLAPGSELVFNYAVTPEHLEPADLATLRELGNYVKRRGEPFRSAFDPDVFPQRVCERGYRLVAQLSMADLHERYFAGRTDGMRPALGGRLAHFATTGTARAPGGPA